MYKPSLDWANEIPHSLLWAGKAWLITSVATVLIMVLLARYTTWGRQFWRVTSGYFTGRQSALVWAWLGVLLLSTLIAVRLEVLLSYFSIDTPDKTSLLLAEITRLFVALSVISRPFVPTVPNVVRIGVPGVGK